MSDATSQQQTTPTSAGNSPSMVSRKVGAGIQARLARLQGATGAAVVTREAPRKFANGYDEPFRERLDGTLRRSLSGTWSVHTLETDASISTDGSQTLIDVQTSPSPSFPSAELKRRRDFTKSWEKQQEAVVDQMLTPEVSRIQASPQPIIEEPEEEKEEEQAPAPAPLAVPSPPPVPTPASVTPIQVPAQEDSKNGILTPPISEPESTPVKKVITKPIRPQTTGPATRVRSRPAPVTSPTPTSAPKTPTRPRPRASASTSSTLAPPVPRLWLTPSPSKPAARASLAPPRSQTSMSARRVSAPVRLRPLSTHVPEKVLPPPVRPRTISKVYEGPTISSLAKQKSLVSPAGAASRAVSRAQ